MKIITLQEEQFDTFASKHRYRNYYQTSTYGHVMEKIGYNAHYLGIIDELGNLIGASLVLYKDIFMGHKYAYMPRGPLFNFTDAALVKQLMEKIKKLLGRQGFMYLKMDPYIPCAIHDEKGTIKNINHEANTIIANLKNANLQYHGLTKFFETEKARWEAITTLSPTPKLIYQGFEKQTRNKIQKALRSGIEIIKEETDDITSLYNIIKKKHDRPLAYYQAIQQEFGKQNAFEIYYAKLNPQKFVINSKSAYDKAMEVNEKLTEKIQNPKQKGTEMRKLINKKMETDKLIHTYKKDLIFATKLLQEHPEGLIIAGMAIIKYDQAIHLLIEGFNPQFKSLNPNYLLKWHIIDKYGQENYKYFNLNAITGEFESKHKYSGLNEMKMNFNAVAIEYVGEFDLIISPLIYNLYKGVNKEKQ